MMVSHRGAKLVRHLSGARLFANSMSMNLRHAAALALVDWYLMVPPISNGTPEIAAPLSHWEIQSSYDTPVEYLRNLYLDLQQAPPALQLPTSPDTKPPLLQLSSSPTV